MGNSRPGDNNSLIAFFSLITIPSFLLLDTGIAIAKGYRPRGRIDFFLIAVTLGFLMTGLLLLVTHSGRSILREYCLRLLLLFGLTILCIVALETLGRIFLPPIPQFHTRGANVNRTFSFSPEIMPGVYGESRFTTNERGIRGPTIPESGPVYRILCLGGSTTECGNLDDKETWPYLLIKSLNESGIPCKFWVGSVGRSGYSTHHHLQFLEQSDLLRGMDCVLVQAGINDLWRALTGWDKNSDPVLLPKPFWYQSRLMHTYRKIQRMAIFRDIENETIDVYILRRRRRQQAKIVYKIPDLSSEIASYKQRLRAMIHQCRKQGISIVFTSQPVLWRENLSEAERELLWFGWLRNGSFLDVDKLRLVMDMYNDALKEICDEMRVGFIDLSTMNGRGAFFCDDCHFNEAGAREVARLVADWFIINLNFWKKEKSFCFN